MRCAMPSPQEKYRGRLHQVRSLEVDGGQQPAIDSGTGTAHRLQSGFAKRSHCCVPAGVESPDQEAGRAQGLIQTDRESTPSTTV